VVSTRRDPSRRSGLRLTIGQRWYGDFPTVQALAATLERRGYDLADFEVEDEG
jgi:hypothetical protein